jgi:hypothetical protein
LVDGYRWFSVYVSVLVPKIAFTLTRVLKTKTELLFHLCLRLFMVFVH